jgi:hypothetical protein
MPRWAKLLCNQSVPNRRSMLFRTRVKYMGGVEGPTEDYFHWAVRRGRGGIDIRYPVYVLHDLVLSSWELILRSARQSRHPGSILFSTHFKQ